MKGMRERTGIKIYSSKKLNKWNLITIANQVTEEALRVTKIIKTDTKVITNNQTSNIRISNVTIMKEFYDLSQKENIVVN